MGALLARVLPALTGRLLPLEGLLLRFTRPGPARLGRLGEALAARRLEALGWRIRARRLRTPAAELDLVALDGDELVVFEVKTGLDPAARTGTRASGGLRSSGADDERRPREHLDREQLRRLRRAARWLARTRGLERSRVVGIEVLVRPGRRPRVLCFDPSPPGTTPGP